MCQDLDAVEALIQGLVLFQGGICMVRTTLEYQVLCLLIRAKIKIN